MHRCRTRLPNTSRARTWIQPSRRHLEVISGPSASHSSSLPLESFLLDAGTETRSCGKGDVHHGLASSVESCLSPDASERPKASELYEMLDGIDRPLPPDPAQAVAANADLLWQADRPSGPLHVGALVDRWTSTLTRAAFFESAAEDLHHRGDTNALRALAHTIESFDHPLTRDLLPGVGRLVPAELERRIHRLIGDRKPR